MTVVTLKAYDSTYGGTPVTLTAADSRQWLQQANDVGSGLCRLQKDHAQVASLPHDAIVQCLIDGTPVFAWVVEPWEQVSVGEGADQLRTFSGRGTLCLWQWGIVYPALGIGRISPAYRSFDFSSPDYDDSAWVAAEEIKQQSDTSSPWSGAPRDWPDPDAYWIWSRAAVAGPPPQPVGVSYFRKKFTLADEATIAFFFTADDGFDLYLDGARVAGETVAFQWGETKRFDVFLDPGDHYLAVRAENITRASASTNVAGFILSGIETDEGGQTLGSVVVSTDATWATEDYPATPPGWTPGKILRTLLNEVKARDSGPQPSPLTNMTVDFSDTLDSDGVPWDEIDISFPVRATYLDVIAQLVETSIDVRMAPDQLVLQAYVKGGAGSDVSATVAFTPTNGTLTKLTHRGSPITATHALTQYADGRWYEASRSAVVRKEVGLEAGTAESTEAVDRIADAFFDHAAVETVTPAAQVEPTSGKTPYTDFEIFDTVSVTDEADAAEDRVVRDIVVTSDEEANAYFDCEYFDV